MDCIKITNLRVFAHHGVFPQETADGQDFYVNAGLFLDCRKAGGSDALEDSVDYGEVCHFITDFLQNNTYRLLEAAAEHLAAELLLGWGEQGLRAVDLELCKPHAPIGLPFENVSVSLHRAWHRVYLSIGSNMGDREAYLRGAVERLSKERSVAVRRVSDFLRTKPYGGVEQEDFLNAAIALDTLLAPGELLNLLHRIERQAGRTREVRWGPRTLDLDIIFYDGLVYEDDALVIPHVDMQNRDFVLRPLLKLCPNFRHPLLHKTVRQLYEELAQGEADSQTPGQAET